jgi:hypothetical protein
MNRTGYSSLLGFMCLIGAYAFAYGGSLFGSDNDGWGSTLPREAVSEQELRRKHLQNEEPGSKFKLSEILTTEKLSKRLSSEYGISIDPKFFGERVLLQFDRTPMRPTACFQGESAANCAWLNKSVTLTVGFDGLLLRVHSPAGAPRGPSPSNNKLVVHCGLSKKLCGAWTRCTGLHDTRTRVANVALADGIDAINWDDFTLINGLEQGKMSAWCDRVFFSNDDSAYRVLYAQVKALSVGSR